MSNHISNNEKEGRASDTHQYLVLFEEAVDGIFLWDTSSALLLEANNAACCLLGYQHDEIVGKPFYSFLGEEDHPRLLSTTEYLLRGTIEKSEWLLKHKCGSWIPVEMTAKLMSDGRCHAFIRDSSERHRIEEAQRLSNLSYLDEQARREREQRFLAEAGAILVRAGADYALALSQIAQATVNELADWCSVNLVFGPDDVRRIKVVHRDLSKAKLCRALERAPVSPQGAPLLFRAIKEQRSMVVSEMTSDFVEALAVSDEHRKLLHAMCPTSCIVVPLVARQRVLGTIAFGGSTAARTFTCRDLVLMEKLASVLAMALDNGRLYEELQQALEVRDEVLGIVAHDLRNPLAAISASSAVIANGPEEASRCGRAAQRIQRCAARMDHLIQDLLDMSRLQAGQRLSVLSKAIGPSVLIAEAVDLQCSSFAAAGRSLSIECAEDLPAVWADPARLGQVLDNLLSNARKFCATQVAVGAYLGEDEVVFFVRNDGANIEAADIPHVFERFWQAKAKRALGAGLGLSIVKNVIHAHGGRVWVTSPASQQTTFYFALPLARIV